MKPAPVLVLAALIVITGCSAAEPAATPTETVTTTATETTTGTATARDTVTETAAPEAAATPTADAEADPTGAFLAEFGREVWADKIVEVIRENGLTIRTAIVDPRGKDGSPAAEQALDFCRAGQEMLQGEGAESQGVRVREADDTTFVVAGMAGDDGCTEY